MPSLSHRPAFPSQLLVIADAQPSEAKCALMCAIDCLPERERMVLSLVYHEGFSVAETALVLDLQAAEVLHSHAAGLDALRASL